MYFEIEAGTPWRSLVNSPQNLNPEVVATLDALAELLPVPSGRDAVRAALDWLTYAVQAGLINSGEKFRLYREMYRRTD
jgi:hypothetical protein